MKRTIYLALAVLFLWGVWFSTPLTALAAEGEVTVTGVELTATRDLIKNYHGEYEVAENGEKWFEYFPISYSEPIITIHYSDNTSEEHEFGGLYHKSWDEVTIQTFENKLDVGECELTVTDIKFLDPRTEKDIEGMEANIKFNIIENPVESIDVVANKKLIENFHGILYTHEDGEQIFNYELEEADIKINVNYTNGTTEVFDYAYFSENCIKDKTGENLEIIYDELALGNNTLTASYMGKETTFDIEVYTFKDVSIKPTKDLIYNFSGTQWDDYFDYDLYYLAPEVTVTYMNNDVKTFTFDEYVEEFARHPYFKNPQTATNQFVLGENTETVMVLGKERELKFNVSEPPVKNVIVTPITLEQYTGGWENDNHYFYNIEQADFKVTLVYSDENKAPETYTYEELREKFDSDASIYVDQSQGLSVGKHEGRIEVLGYVGTFEVEILENSIKSVEAVATKKLVENETGSLNGEDDGEPYFYYDIFETEPTVTVTFSNGEIKTYAYSEIGNIGYGYSIEADQDAKNQLKVGKNKGYIKVNGVKAEFDFEIVESLIKNISAKATEDLIEKESGWYNDATDEKSFWYDLNQTNPLITVDFNDGTSETYSYNEFVENYDFTIYFSQDNYNNPFKVGENTTIVQIGNYKSEFKFNIVKPEVAVTNIKVIPEGILLEGAFCDVLLDEETTEQYCVYYEDTITYTLVVNYSDGTSKTYKNLSSSQDVDGAPFYIDFECDDYENRYVVGKNKAYAMYKGARTTFDVEVVKNDIKAIEISGENELVLTTISTDGKKTNYVAKYFENFHNDYDEMYGILITDKGTFEVVFEYSLTPGGDHYIDITANLIFADGKTIKSNKLPSNNWLDVVEFVRNVDEDSVWLYCGFSKAFFGSSFHGFSSSVLKGTLVDKALSLCSNHTLLSEYKNIGMDETGPYAILSLEEAQSFGTILFEKGKLDIESSPLYNASAKEIKVYFMHTNNDGSNKNLVYENGKFVLKSVCINPYNGEKVPVEVVFLANGNVDSISVGSHSFSSEITKHPTATQVGVRTHTCECGESYTESLAKLICAVEPNVNNDYSGKIDLLKGENLAEKIEITEEEQKLITSGVDFKLILEVDDIGTRLDTQEKKEIAKAIGTQKLGAFIDIKLVKQIGDTKINIEKTVGEISVSVKLPDSLINFDEELERVYKVARYHDDDEQNVTILDATFDKATHELIFSTDRFSTYAIIYEDVAADGKDDVPKAGVISTSVLWIGAMAISGIGALAFAKKKKED